MRPIFASILLASAALYSAPKLVSTVTVDRPDGNYQPGETATWTISISNDGQLAEGNVVFDLKQGGLKTIRKGKLPLKDGKATLQASLDKPGTINAYLSYSPEGSKTRIRDYAGAVWGADKITPSAAEPADFDAFWKAQIEALHKIPMNPQLTPVKVQRKGIEAYRITLDNIWGTRVQGVIAFPKGQKNLPAKLLVEGAGVRGLNPNGACGRASSGWLVMHIIAHDIQPDQPKEFYDNLSKTKLKNYPLFGRENREKSYFLRMLLACRRSLDYLTTRSEWDGKRLVVSGGSQGGFQSIAAAGLDERVTHIIIHLPAGCDHTGHLSGRKAGWPGWNTRSANQIKDVQATLETSKYFDCVNFAKRAKCASLVGVGLIDLTCPPEGIYAMFNQLPVPKKIISMPDVGHGGIYSKRRGKYYTWSKKWDEAIRKNQPLPLE